MPTWPHPTSAGQRRQNVAQMGAHASVDAQPAGYGARPMAELLTWRDAWKTGIAWVDRDHREIARLINRLAESCGRGLAAPDRGDATQGCPPATLLSAVDALVDRARKHFASEEELLRAVGYPALREHCSEHVMQLAELSQLRRDLLGTSSLGPESLQGIKRWFLEHVIAEDRRYLSFYHSR